jgi:hypothetical protein
MWIDVDLHPSIYQGPCGSSIYLSYHRICRRNVDRRQDEDRKQRDCFWCAISFQNKVPVPSPYYLRTPPVRSFPFHFFLKLSKTLTRMTLTSGQKEGRLENYTTLSSGSIDRTSQQSSCADYKTMTLARTTPARLMSFLITAHAGYRIII